MKQDREIHYRYWLAILGIGIVILVSGRYYNVPNLVGQLSFALTLSSLILAVLAIFYTIVTSQTQQSQLSRLAETDTKIASAAGEITSAARELQSFAREAPEQFETLGKKIERLSDASSPIGDVDKSKVQEIATSAGDETAEMRARKLIARMSFDGMLGTYALSLAYSNSRYIEPADFQKLSLGSDFLLGVANGLAGNDVLAFRVHNGAIIVASGSPILSEVGSALDRVETVLGPDWRDYIAARRREIKGVLASRMVKASESKPVESDEPTAETSTEGSGD